MKRLFIFLIVLVFMTGMVFATGQPEETGRYDLTWELSGDDDFYEDIGRPEGWKGKIKEWQAEQFMQANPNVNITIILRDVSQGSMTLDSMMAAGKPPDVMVDAQWLFAKYLVPEFALPLEEYIDVSRFQDDLVDMYTRDGHVYALVHNNITIGFAANLDMLETIGYALPSQSEWVWDEFDRLSEKLKAVNINSTVIMTQPGLFSWPQMWAQSAGGTMFENNDYSKVTMNTPEYAEGLRYMKSLVDRGYTDPRPNECNDDTGIENFAAGKIFGATLQTGHVSGWVPQMLESGALEKEFKYTFLEVPHAPSVEHAAVAGYQSLAIGHRSEDEGRNKVIAKLIEHIFSQENLDMDASIGIVPAIKGFIPKVGRGASPPNLEMLKLSQSAPPMDTGRLLPQRKAIYRAWTPFVHEFMNGKISAEDLLDVLEIEANKLLK